MSASSKKKLRKEQNASALTEKQLKQQAEAKKLKITSTLFVVAMIVVLVAALTIMVVSGVRSSGMIEKNTIALTVGDHKINTVEMNYYFVDTVSKEYNEWNNIYGEYLSFYLSSMGLDINQPLNEQTYLEEDRTWADFFMEQAIDQAAANYALYDQAIAEGKGLTDEDKATIDGNIGMMGMYASLAGYSLDDYLKIYYGSGSNEESIRDYMEVTTVAANYYNSHEASLSYDDTAIRAYENGIEENYNSYSYNSYYLSCSSFLPEGATENPTDAQNEAAAAEAKAAAESLLNATTTEELDAAISALSINANNASATSTKFENVLYTNMTTAIQSWVADASRQENDIAVIANEVVADHEHTEEEHEHETKIQGYYVVMFRGSTDNSDPMANVRHLLVQFEEDADGNVTDEAKAAAKTEAEQILKELLDAGNGTITDEAFAAMATERSDDGGSAPDGGLIADINPDSAYVANFLNWAIAPERVAGDAEIVGTEYGYHVMYYVGDDELSYRDHMIVTEMKAAEMESWYLAIKDAAAITEGNLSRVKVDSILANY